MSRLIDAVPALRIGPRGEARGAASVDARAAAFTSQQLVLLTAVTLLAAVLRLFRLGEWALWVDEAHTFRDAVTSAEAFWSSEVRLYPVSYLVLRGLFALGMPASEGWLRLPFVFFGIMSVPALGILGRIIVGPRAALLAALLLAVSPWHIFWSQSARAYPIVLFLVLVAAGAFYEGLLRRSVLLLLTGLAVTVIAGLCHPSAYILLGGLFVYGFLALRDPHSEQSKLMRWLPGGILLLIAGLLYVLLPVLQHAHRVKPDFSLFHLVQTLVFFVRTPLLVAAIGGLLLLSDRGDRGAPFLLCWVVVPVLVLAALATVKKVTAQYAFYTLPAFCLLAAVVVRALADGVATRSFRGYLLRIVPLGILLVDMTGQTYLYFQKYHGERPRWREAAQWIEQQQTGSRKRVLTTNGPSMTYYLDPGGFAVARDGGETELIALAPDVIGDGGQFMQDQVGRARADDVELYVVLTEPELGEMDPQGLMSQYLRNRFYQRRWYPNWTGPKDMSVLVYSLPRD